MNLLDLRRSRVDSNGRTIWNADAHNCDGKRFIVRVVDCGRIIYRPAIKNDSGAILVKRGRQRGKRRTNATFGVDTKRDSPSRFNPWACPAGAVHAKARRGLIY